MSKANNYLNFLKANTAETLHYHTKSVVKTEQQKALEALLVERGLQPAHVADIACGGGALSYHLKALYPAAHFTLCDLDTGALELAHKLNGDTDFTYAVEDLNTLAGLPDDSFDLVCCWQTLLVTTDPHAAVHQPTEDHQAGRKDLASSLFNHQHDMDIRAELFDHTRPSTALGHSVHYNTYSLRTVARWLEGLKVEHHVHPFTPNIDIVHDGKGLGTFTVNSDRGRLQISGGVLMNWGILEIVK
ncbi:MAG: class I SAM-dependent methyltransferase [Flavobacteriales bacterium]|nr:class I SAM-dependent methyltransferase [Flavobacteriales bacterium]